MAFHGALMKGEAIHRIAAECIIRYFFRCIRQERIPKVYGKPGQYKLYECLKDAFRDNPLIMNQNPETSPIIKSRRFNAAIDNLVDAGIDLLDAKIGVLVPNRAEWL